MTCGIPPKAMPARGSESPDPHFLPITDLTIRWLNQPAMLARFPFAMINREQLVTVVDESSTPVEDVTTPAVA